MDQRLTALERAFQLAKSGQVATIAELRTVLKLEGFGDLQLEGASLIRQLRGLIEAALVARAGRSALGAKRP